MVTLIRELPRRTSAGDSIIYLIIEFVQRCLALLNILGVLSTNFSENFGAALRWHMVPTKEKRKAHPPLPY